MDTETLIRSLGYGVYLLTSSTEQSARRAAGQMGKVLEIWPDPGDPKSYLAISDTGHPTSVLEARLIDEEVSSSVMRAILASPSESLARSRLSVVAAGCKRFPGQGLGELFSGF